MDIEHQIRSTEVQINLITKIIQQNQLTLLIFELVLKDLKGKKVIADAERIVRECKKT